LASTLGFEFPADVAGTWDGFNDPGIEHFSGNPFEHLGREVLQNAVDATATSPARIKIRLVDVDTATIPDIAAFSATIAACGKAAEGEGAKAQKFFAEAQRVLKRPKLQVLQFADYNTTGVRGPCINGRPYFALMKAKGQSQKPSADTLGSYGIGKFAPYTVSALRTVFVSTIWQDQETTEWHHYVQGKSILMSHLEGSVTRTGTGFWGVKKECKPHIGLHGLPAWLKRTDDVTQLPKVAGTTINILGFSGPKEWREVLAATIAESFFGAIYRGSLEVEIEGGLVLNQGSIASVFQDTAVRAAIKDLKGEPEKFDNAANYLRTLMSTEHIPENTQQLHLGHCHLTLLVGEQMPKKVAILRNGMMITEDLAGLRRFGEFKEFCAVFECQSKEGNARLRAMEPPAHNAFEPDRLASAKEVATGRMIVKDMAAWVRAMLKRHAQNPVQAVTNVDELAEFFGDEQETGDGKKSDEVNPEGKLTIRARPMKRKKPKIEIATDEAGEDGGEEELTENGGGGGGGGSGGGGAGPGTKASETRTVAELRNVRAVPVAADRRTIAFTPGETGKLVVELQDSGADTNRPLIVTSSSHGKVANGRIVEVETVAGQRLSLDVVLQQPFAGTVRVVAYAI
jgi:hypothetical protein